jgi:CDP-diacylglycerol--glycerol-3-phosphate 3-phosphatidyltransferase
MLTIPNFLSFLRFPLAILFIQGNITVRLVTILCAALTDFLDGYLARQYQQKTQFGTILDPLADKFFVASALSLFFVNGQISVIEVCAMLCRDFSVIIFGVYLVISGNFEKYHFRSIWSGKITTTLQLIALVALSLEVNVPSYLYSLFVLLGCAALIELYLSDHTFIPPELSKKNRAVAEKSR